MEKRDIMQVLPVPEVPTYRAGMTVQLPPEVAQAFAQMAQAMQGMADMLRATNERLASVENEVRLLTKVTPAQATAINAAVRDRAAALCADYRATGREQLVANAIRKAMKLTLGVNAVRELPRCQYSVAMELVDMWDDYKAMKAIKNREG